MLKNAPVRLFRSPPDERVLEIVKNVFMVDARYELYRNVCLYSNKKNIRKKETSSNISLSAAQISEFVNCVQSTIK